MKTCDIIEAHIEDTQPKAPTRGYLGMSGIGHDCVRKLWYDFRFANYPHFTGETLLKFADGHYSEDLTAERMRAAMPDLVLKTHKPDGEQYGFKDVYGHFRGHIDGIARNLPEWDAGTWAIWEHKCCDRVKANKLVKLAENDESSALANWNFTYYIQAILYMYYAKVDHHLMTVAHSGSRKYVQVKTPANHELAEEWVQCANYVVTTMSPPDRYRDDPEYYQCKWCDHNKVCHSDALPEVNCRTCIHCMPVIGGDNVDGEWHCKRHDKIITTKEQIAACDKHLYNPIYFEGRAYVAEAGHDYILYRINDSNAVFTNTSDHDGFSSTELKATAFTLLKDSTLMDIKSRFDGEIIAMDKDVFDE